jgi:hypothetical protein
MYENLWRIKWMITKLLITTKLTTNCHKEKLSLSSNNQYHGEDTEKLEENPSFKL